MKYLFFLLLLIFAITGSGFAQDEVEFGDPLFLFPENNASPDIFDAKLSPDGEYIVAIQAEDRANETFSLLLWETEGIKPSPILEKEQTKAPGRSYIWLEFAPDSERFALLVEGYVQIFQLPQLEPILTYENDKVIDLPRMAWSLDGQYLGVLYENEAVVWDTEVDKVYEQTSETRLTSISPLETGWYLQSSEEGLFNICDTVLTVCETYGIPAKFTTPLPLAHQNRVFHQVSEEGEQTTYLWQPVDDECCTYEMTEVDGFDARSIISSWNEDRYLVTVHRENDLTEIFDFQTMEILSTDLPTPRQNIGLYMDETLIFIHTDTDVRLYRIGENTPLDMLTPSEVDESIWETMDPYSIPEAFNVMGSPNWILVTYGNFHMLIPIERN